MADLDDEIRAVAALKKEEEDCVKDFTSEYSTNLEFIVKYEKSLAWKAKRLKIILGNFRQFVKYMLSVSVIRLIKNTHEN